MSLRLIIGRSGTGKSTLCISEIKKRDLSSSAKKIIMLVPEQYTFETENKLLHEVGEKFQLNTYVLSFQRLAHKVFSEHGGITKLRIQESGKSMLVLKVLNELQDSLTSFKTASKQKGFIDIVSKTISEFKKYNVDSEVLDQVKGNMDESRSDLKNKITDLGRIYSSFQEKLHKSHVDSEDILIDLSQKIDESGFFNDAEVWIDEFTNFTPIQYEIIEKIIAQSISTTITLDLDTPGNFGDAFLVTANTYNKLRDICSENNIRVDETINLNKEKNYKFLSRELLHLEQNYYSYPFKQYKDEVKNLRIYKANNSYEEMEFIARDILRLVREGKYRYKDIAVLCRDIEGYEKIASVICNQYGIPSYIDKKKDVMGNPIIVLINSLFDIINKNWTYESVFKYLKTGLVDIDNDKIDLLENYVLSNGIKGRNKWVSDDMWDYDIYKSFGEKERDPEEVKLINEINEIRDMISQPINNFYEKCKSAKNVREVCTYLYEFLNEFSVLSKMENMVKYFQENNIVDMATEYSKVLDIIMEVLDEAVDVLGDEKLPLDEFAEILNTGFMKYEMSLIPLALDQVTIGDIAKIKSKDVKALYVVGVNDGVIPAVNKEEGILSDRDREFLKEQDVVLASDTKTKAREEQHIVYNILSTAREYLVLSYCAADFEGKALRPSIVIPRIKKIFPRLEEESDIYSGEMYFDKFKRVSAPLPTFNEFICESRNITEKKQYEKYWLQVYTWFKNNDEWKIKTENMLKALNYTNQAEDIDREKIKEMYEKDGKLTFNISMIENYARCPFSYYIKYGLKAKDRKIYELTAPDLGNFMHEILDEFTNSIREENMSWSDLSYEKCKSRINELVDKQLLENKGSIFNSSKRYRYFTDRFKRMLTKSVTIISEQMKHSDFKVYKNEFSFGNYKDGEPIKLDLPSGDEVFLKGRIDRIDTAEIDGNTYIRIIDYKSGYKKFDLSELYYGIQIQLLVYIDALLKNSEYILKTQAVPGAIFYFRIDDPIINVKGRMSEEAVKKEILKKLKLDGLMLKDPKIVKAMDNDIEGTSLIIPAGFKKDGDFSSKSAVVTERQFEALRKYVNDKMIELCEDMISGKITIEPIKQGLNVPCTYCEYTSICQFDTSMSDNCYRFIYKKSKEEIWEAISKETGINLGGEK